MFGEDEESKDNLVDEDVKVEDTVGKKEDDNVNDENGTEILVVDVVDYYDEVEVDGYVEVVVDVDVGVDVLVVVTVHVDIC